MWFNTTLTFILVLGGIFTLFQQIKWLGLWKKSRTNWSDFERKEFGKQKYIKLVIVLVFTTLSFLGWFKLACIYLYFSLVITCMKYFRSGIVNLTWNTWSTKFNKIIYLSMLMLSTVALAAILSK